MSDMEYSTLVIGGGIAGYTAALSAREAGGEVAIVAGRPGASSMSSGIFHTDADPGRVRDIALPEKNSFTENMNLISIAEPYHPYSILAGAHSPQEMLRAIDCFLKYLAEAGLETGGAADRYMLLMNNLGTMNRARFALKSIADGDVASPGKMKLAIIGIKGFADYDPGFIAASGDALARRISGEGFAKIDAFEVAVKGYENSDNMTTTQVAEALDEHEITGAFAETVKRNIAGGEYTHTAFPAVLGLKHHREVISGLAEYLGIAVFEIATLQPSVPGIRIMNALRSLATRKGITVIKGTAEAVDTGDDVIAATISGGSSVYGTPQKSRIAAGKVIVATGRFIGGGIEHGNAGDDIKGGGAGLVETLTGIIPICYKGHPVKGGTMMNFVTPTVAEPQPVFSCGVMVDAKLRPLDANGTPVHENLRCAGSIIGGYDPCRGKCGTGAAAVTGYFAGME